MDQLRNKNVVVLGGSRGVGREIALRASSRGARVLTIARTQDDLNRLADAVPGIGTLAIDAATENAPERVAEILRPDVLIICGGALPPTRPLHELTWREFSVNWETDTRMSFLFCQYALRAPLAPGATVILISSGAGLGGSPISGGYAGAKRMQMFIAGYCQKESTRLGLGIRFVALTPLRIMPETELGKKAVQGYAQYLGIQPADFVNSMTDPQAASDVAEAALAIAEAGDSMKDVVYTVSAQGIKPISPQ